MRLLLVVILIALLVVPASATFTPRNKTDAGDVHAHLNTSWMNTTINATNFNTSIFTAFFGALMLPYTTYAGNVFYIFVYVLPLAVIWVRQEKALMPVGLSVLFGGLLLPQLPESWQMPAELFIVLTVVGLLYSMFKERG